MINGFENVQKVGQDNINRAVESFSALSRGWQALAVETADFSRKSFQDGAAHVETLLGTQTFDRAVKAQTDFVTTAYENAVGQAARLGEIYLGVAKDVAKPFEGIVPTTSK